MRRFTLGQNIYTALVVLVTNVRMIHHCTNHHDHHHCTNHLCAIREGEVKLADFDLACEGLSSHNMISFTLFRVCC